MLKFWKSAIAAFILLSTSAYAQQVDLIGNIKNNPDGSQTLLNHVPQAVAQGLATDISQVNSNQTLNLRILLPSKNQAGLDSFIKELYDPKSPNYHQFLTPAQFDLLYGASTTDSPIVSQYLKSQGLTVEGQSKNGFILTVTGPASKVESAFKVVVNNYKAKDGTAFFSPNANPVIPPQIAGKVYAIVGMDNVTKFYPHYVPKKLPGVVNPKVSTKGATSQPAFSGPDNTIEPSDILTAYNMNSITSTGSGQTQGLFELDGYLASDIATYENTFNLPNVTLTNIYTDGFNGTPGTSAVEDVLDIEISVAVAPGLSSIQVYEAPDTEAGWVDQWDTIANSGVKIISCSWGAYEAGSYPYYDHTVFSELAAQGQAVFASAGDSGAYDNCSNVSLQPNCTDSSGDPITPILSVDDPASDQYITGVGISLLTVNSNGTYSSETASLQGGGGVSSYVSIPSYQTTAASSASPAAKVSTTMRNVPDVVLTADPQTDYLIYVTIPPSAGAWYGVWGSSAASPIWAAFLSRVNQGRLALNQSDIGFLNPSIYQVEQSSRYVSDFHDITTGNNSYYPAKTGFDDATGLGSFNGANLYSDLIGLAAPTGLNATGGSTQVVLNWTASTGAVSYNVERSTVSGSSYTTISTSGEVTAANYTDSTVTNGTTYYYVVNAVNAVGIEGVNSAQASATPEAETAPTAPTVVSAVTGPLNAQATVTFSGALPNGSAITAYTVTSSPGGFTGTGSASPITVAGLTDGTSYTFTVKATNGVGTSAASVPSNSVVAGSPSPPTTVTAVRGNASATVTFSGALPVGSAITGYTVTSSPGGFTGTGLASPITVSGLINGTSYTFTVTAVNSYGSSVASVASGSVIPAGPPVAPTMVTAVEGNAAATVTFSGALPNGSVITSYTVTSSPGGLTGTGSASPITVPGLINGTSYTFTVTATNSVGTSAPSSPSNSVIPGSPLPPTTITAVGGNTQAIVTFSGASSVGSAITSYTVTSNPGGFTRSGAVSPITVSGLINGTPYTFTVAATNIYGTSAASAPSNSVTPTAVEAPSGLNETILAARIGGHIIYAGVSLTWKQSVSPGIIKNKVYRSAGSGAYSLLATISTSTSYIDTNVISGTTYHYGITAYDSNGAESAYSNTVSVNY